MTAPKFSDFIDRDVACPPFTDTYDTDTPYTLRKLFLLVWYSRKHGSKPKIGAYPQFPQYMFDDYGINGEKLTDEFLKAEYLYDTGDRIRLTKKGWKLAKDFSDLWEIHRARERYILCFDEDFPLWNKGRRLGKFISAETEFYQARIKWLKKYAHLVKDDYDEYNSVLTSIEAYETSIKQNQIKLEALS
ncbi:hypothetical protein [Lactobacillus corticis]|uniref:Uncharacterized protein n=1 Tax=Lactobacillus corticis TaxID=2201249 RepID=A0A916QK99_9LACO|nr:hypothetical protein [Lactobacillus corticis]GFZ27462.1 hypothetical protein LCB40_13420 [Lactobacillus corticis]